MPPADDVRLQVSLGGGDVDAVRAVPALGAVGHHQPGQWVVGVAAAQRVQGERLLGRAREGRVLARLVARSGGLARDGVGASRWRRMEITWKEGRNLY